jgi:hypothetical protein
MPLVYRRHSTPIQPEPSTSSTLSLTDADDSIVLSDLLRSGEASRLRRRGAIFIRDPPTTAPRPVSTTSPRIHSPTSLVTRRIPPLVVLPAPGYPDEYEEEEEEEYGPEWEFGSAAGNGAGSVDAMESDARRLDLEAEMRLEDADQSAGRFMLYCGGPMSDAPEAEHVQPRRKASAFHKPSRTPIPRRTNGCGALLHISAIPRRKYGVWIARGDATDAIAPLHAEYFDCSAVAKMMKSKCGCVREGIGCRFWYAFSDIIIANSLSDAQCSGNTLGTIFRPCRAAAEGLFSTSPSPSPSRPSTAPPTSPPLASPSNPPLSSGVSYALPRTRSPPPAPPVTSVFTFFSNSVQPSPFYAFPPSTAHVQSLPPWSQPQQRPSWTAFTVSRPSNIWERSELIVDSDPDGEDSLDGDETVRGGEIDAEADSTEKVESNPAVWVER